MRLVIASDIHGSSTWCARLMETIEAEAPDRVVLLGDLLYHGPRNDLPDGYAPKEVIAMLSGIADRVIAVRGNCDAEVDQMVLPFPCMADYALINDGGRTLFATHGHLWGVGFHNSVCNPPDLRDGDVLLFGHTHVKVNDDVRVPDRIVIRAFNPGSVGIPKDGTHSCGVYVDGVLEHRVLG